MDAKELAEKLNGRSYTSEITREEVKEAKDSGLVVVFGSSDDLMEFRGAIYDEVGAYDGGTAYLNEHGLIQNKCDYDDCPYFKESLKQAKTIEALWFDGSSFCWTYKTEIPHEVFEIYDGEDAYCIGIVFRLADAA